MGSIQIRKDNENRVAQPNYPAFDWEPSRLMRSFFGWDPFREMAPLAVNQERFTFTPAFEVKETPEGYLFKADVPGVKEADLEVTLKGDRLTVSGKREQEKEQKSETYYTFERTYGSFTRSFTLPTGVDGDRVHADLREGVLTLLVPKRPEAQARKINIKTEGQR